MMDSGFSEAFLDRLAQIASKVETEVMSAGVVSEPFLCLNFRPPAAAKRDIGLPARKALDHLYHKRRQVFARVVQFFADQCGRGSIEGLGDGPLMGLARRALAATDRCDEDQPVEGWSPCAQLERLLTAHHDLGKQIVYAENEAMEEREHSERVRAPNRHLKAAEPIGYPDPLESALTSFHVARCWLQRLSAAPPEQIEQIGRNVERTFRAFLGAAAAMDDSMRDQLYHRIGELLPADLVRRQRV
jgi:hypothetical protein